MLLFLLDLWLAINRPDCKLQSVYFTNRTRAFRTTQAVIDTIALQSIDNKFGTRITCSKFIWIRTECSKSSKALAAKALENSVYWGHVYTTHRDASGGSWAFWWHVHPVTLVCTSTVYVTTYVTHQYVTNLITYFKTKRYVCSLLVCVIALFPQYGIISIFSIC